MDPNEKRWIEVLEAEWSMPDGFLGKAREGLFSPKEGEAFLKKLCTIKFEGDEVSRRLISLLWYIPLFLSWQKERISENKGDIVSFERFTNQIQEIVENILGVP